MNAYLHFLFFDGAGIFAARMALSGTAHMEVLNMRDPLEMAVSRKALAGFRSAAPDAQRDPCPWECVLLIAAFLADRNAPGDTDAARACVLCFDACLRPSELLAVTLADVTVLTQPSVLQHPSVCMRIAPFLTGQDNQYGATKSGDCDDTVILGDPACVAAGRGWVATWLSDLKLAGKASAPVVKLTLPRWEACVIAAVSHLGLRKLRITPHCFRHGAASTDVALGLRDLSAVQTRGRWKAAASVGCGSIAELDVQRFRRRELLLLPRSVSCRGGFGSHAPVWKRERAGAASQEPCSDLQITSTMFYEVFIGFSWFLRVFMAFWGGYSHPHFDTPYVLL